MAISEKLEYNSVRGDTMLRVDYTEFKGEAGKYCAAAENGEVVFIAAPKINLVILTENEYAEMLKAKHNADYLKKLNKARAQLDAGQGQIHELIEV